jgi:hypothetical protein
LEPSGSDDTPAFNAAFAQDGNTAEMIRGCTYSVRPLSNGNGSVLYGWGAPNYVDEAPWNSPRLVPLPGTKAIFDFSDATRGRGVVLRDFTIVGDGACTAISGGSDHLTIDGLYIVDCLDGLGGAVNGSSTYSCVVTALHCRFMRCTHVGVISPIDSEFDGCIIADCGTSVYAHPGANHNRWRGGRVEWSKLGEHFRLAGDSSAPVRDWTFDGVQMDRAATCSVFMRHCHHIQFGGSVASERPGRAGLTGPGESTHFYCEDSSVITPTGVLMWAGADDDGSGIVSPRHAFEFAGVNEDVILSGGCVRGGYTAKRALHYLDGRGRAAMPGHRITGVGGLKDFRHRWWCFLASRMRDGV